MSGDGDTVINQKHGPCSQKADHPSSENRYKRNSCIIKCSCNSGIREKYRILCKNVTDPSQVKSKMI